MSMTNKPVEPSMEEILASIRKIIAEEPIGTRPDPVNHQAAKAAPRSDGGQKRSPMLEALAIDDVVDMAGGAGQSPGAGGRGVAANGTHGGVSGQEKRAAAQSTRPAEATMTGNGAARSEEAKPVADLRSPDGLGATVPGRKAELDTPPERPAAQSVDAALSEAQKKVDRHFGSLPEPAERPAPLGLRSIRDPLRDVKAAGGSLTSRVAAATQAAQAEPVADKARGGNGAAGAGTTAAAAPAKQTETTPATKTDGTAAKVTGQATVATSTPVSATQSESTKPAAGQSKASLEEAVAEMLRPMLNTWLEANLSRIVEQVVREHVAKTPLPGKDKPAA
jgi:cell pole-organizing protein PopZ